MTRKHLQTVVIWQPCNQTTVWQHRLLTRVSVAPILNLLKSSSLGLNKMEKLEKQQQIIDRIKRNEELGKINKNYIEYHRFLHNELQEARGNIRVYCRIRPKLSKEKLEDTTPENYIEFPNSGSILLNGPSVNLYLK